MITGAVKNKVDKIWTDIWAGGTISGGSNYVGGIAGYNSGTVSECKWLIGTADKGIGGGTDSGATSYDVSCQLTVFSARA